MNKQLTNEKNYLTVIKRCFMWMAYLYFILRSAVVNKYFLYDNNMCTPTGTPHQSQDGPTSHGPTFSNFNMLKDFKFFLHKDCFLLIFVI